MRAEHVRQLECESPLVIPSSDNQGTYKPQPVKGVHLPKPSGGANGACPQYWTDLSIKSKLGYQSWALGIYLLSSGPKAISSMKLHRELGIFQKSAWHLGHRLREGFACPGGQFAEPVGKQLGPRPGQRPDRGRAGGGHEQATAAAVHVRAGPSVHTDESTAYAALLE